MEINEILKENINNNDIIELNEKLSTFEKLKNIQMLIKKEASLKQICTEIYKIKLYNYFFSY